MTSAVTDASHGNAWVEHNRAYLEAHLQRMRLRIQRRVLWLRERWSENTLNNYQSMVISDREVDRLLDGEENEREAEFYASHPAAVRIGAKIQELDALADEIQQRLLESNVEVPLYALGQTFNLSSFELDVLLLCFASTLDSGFARLFAYLQDDAQARCVTPHLALAILGAKTEDRGQDGIWADLDHRSCFHAEAPLRRFGLLNVDVLSHDPCPPYHSPLRLDERMTHFIQGVNVADSPVTTLLKPVPRMPLFAELQQVCDLVMGDLDRESAPGVFNLLGARGSGQDAVAAHICGALGCKLFQLDPRQIPERGQIDTLTRLLDRESALLPMMLYVEMDAGAAGDDSDELARAFSARTKDLLERLHTRVFLASETRLHVDRNTRVYAIPKPNSMAQRAMWRAVLDDDDGELTNELEPIVQQFDLGPREIAEIAQAAFQEDRQRQSAVTPNQRTEQIWRLCRGHVGPALDGVARRIVPVYGWEDIVLPQDAAQQLREIAAQVEHRGTVYDRWGFGGQMNRGRGITALFSGPSGTGKTMAAEVLARQLHLDLYGIDLAGVVSKYIGETEKRLRRLFDTAEGCGALLFFDEADALFGKRTEVKDSHDRYANIEVNYLLQRMEEYRGLAVLATNRKSSLDQAFLRRLRFLVDFPFPDATDRREIWERAFPDQASTSELDFAALARLEIPGGNIRNIALNSAFLAAEQGASIEMDHVMRAARREYEKISKMVSQAEFGAHLTSPGQA